MNPHLVFNSLNIIKHFVYINNNKKADFAIDCFSIFLRRFLEYSSKQEIQIIDEVKLLETYINLEKLRSNDSFDYEIKIVNGIQNIFIPNLIIQPYVENAIKHGVLNLEYPGKIEINFIKDKREIVCTIRDNGKGYENKCPSNLNVGKHEPKGLLLVSKKILILKKLKKAKVEVMVKDLKTQNRSGTEICLKIS